MMILKFEKIHGERNFISLHYQNPIKKFRYQRQRIPEYERLRIIDKNNLQNHTNIFYKFDKFGRKTP